MNPLCVTKPTLNIDNVLASNFLHFYWKLDILWTNSLIQRKVFFSLSSYISLLWQNQRNILIFLDISGGFQVLKIHFWNIFCHLKILKVSSQTLSFAKSKSFYYKLEEFLIEEISILISQVFKNPFPSVQNKFSWSEGLTFWSIIDHLFLILTFSLFRQPLRLVGDMSVGGVSAYNLSAACRCTICRQLVGVTIPTGRQTADKLYADTPPTKIFNGNVFIKTPQKHPKKHKAPTNRRQIWRRHAADRHTADKF